MKKDRKPGFYWVELDPCARTVALWYGGYWYLPAPALDLTDASFRHIGPRVPEWKPKKRRSRNEGKGS
jgi:hypothetical protein